MQPSTNANRDGYSAGSPVARTPAGGAKQHAGHAAQREPYRATNRRTTPQTGAAAPPPQQRQPYRTAPKPQPQNLFEDTNAVVRQQPQNLFEMYDDTPRTAAAPRQRQASSPRADAPTRVSSAHRSQGRPASQGDTIQVAAARGYDAQPRSRKNSGARGTASGSGRNSTGGGRGGSGGGRGGSGGGRRGGQNRGPADKGGVSTAKFVMLNILKAFFVLFCLAVVAVSALAVQAVGYVVETTANDEEILNLDDLTYSETSYLMALNPNNPNAEAEDDWIVYQKLVGGETDSTWVPLADISPTLVDAVLSTEDREFFDHDGVSLKRTLFAAFNQVFHVRDSFGASTLDQQLVKNLTGENEVVDEDGDMTVGYQRKMREIFRAYWLNNNYSKETILETYLNTLPLSGTIVGVKAAAREYFNITNLNDLNPAQCATIAGITQAPGKYNPFVNPDNCLARRNDVLLFMYQNGKLTEAEMNRWMDEPLGLEKPTNIYRPTDEVNSYFSDTVLESVVADIMASDENISRTMALHQYYNGGLRIYTTIDLRMQEEMEAQYQKGWGDQADGFIFPDITQPVEKKDENGNVVTVDEHPQSAMVVLGYDGQLKGVVGGIGEKRESLSLNRATQSVRQVGSTMKPIAAYALGIDYGWIDYSTIMPDTYVANSTGQGEPNWPRNFSGQPTGGNMTVEHAVAQSVNTVAAHIGNRVGVEEMFEFLRDTLQVTSLVSNTEDPVTNDMGLSALVLGGMTHGMTPYELAGAYQMFGNEGKFTSLHCYTRIEDASGNIKYKPKVTTVQAISSEAAYIMNRLLANVVGSGGTASGMKLDYMDSVGKTGTTTGGSEDNDRWFVGLTPYYVSAVWWGYDTNELLEWPARATTNPPPMMWKTVMEAVQADLPEIGFPEMPEGVLRTTYCRETGMLAGPGCPSTGTGYYIANGRVPSQCTAHSGDAPPEGDAQPDAGEAAA